MKYKVIRYIRIAVSLFVLLGLIFFFVSSSSFATGLWAKLLKIQFVPALLGVLSAGTVTVAAVLLLTIIFGRVYCSWICPLGIYQDVVITVSSWFKTKKQRRFHYRKPATLWRYSILLFVGICAAFGFVLPLTWIDPYGLFGKMAVQLAHPIWPVCLFGISFFIVITLLAAFRGRYYCNTICPVGTLLGFISKFSMFRLDVNLDKCRHCLLCGMHCKSSCLDSKNVYIDHSRCVGCLECIPACSENALRYTFAWKRKPKTEKPVSTDNSRRAFLLASMGLAGGVVLLNKYKMEKPKRVEGSMPPGAGDLERFKDKCVACYACVASCPSQIIKPSFLQLGWEGTMLPTISYENGFCGYDCQRCQEVCPSGALPLMPLEEKKRVKLGVAKFTLKNCIIVKDGTDCGACDEHCPVKAVALTEKEGYPKPVPKMTPKLCIGCGGCEFICPARPKAIVVVPMAIQLLADVPQEGQKKEVAVDDFGF